MNSQPGIKSQAVFGAADGVTVLLGVLVPLAAHPHQLVKAALGCALAELVGMSAGVYLSDGTGGWKPALANGGAAFTACFTPAVPYLIGSGPAALAAALMSVIAVGAVVAWLRPERGWLAIGKTYGILAAAAVLCTAAAAI